MTKLTIMEMHQIKYFLAVAEERHISRAAQRCHVSQPSLSRAIQKMEEELGGILFSRKPGRVDLTEFGQHVLPLLRQCFEQAIAAKNEAAYYLGLRERQLRAGLMTTVFHPKFTGILDKLSSRFKRLDVKVNQAEPHILLQQLLADEIEAAVVTRSDVRTCDNFCIKDLYTENYVICFPPQHRFSAMDTVPLQEIQREPVINTGLTPKLLRNIAQIRAKEEGELRYSFASNCLAMAMVRSGFGCAFLPEFAPLSHELEKRPVCGADLSRVVCLVTMRGRLLSPVASAFVNLTRGTEWTQSNAKGAL
jgi:DNA-binding transcriptional LysR family regulator